MVQGRYNQHLLKPKLFGLQWNFVSRGEVVGLLISMIHGLIGDARRSMGCLGKLGISSKFLFSGRFGENGMREFCLKKVSTSTILQKKPPNLLPVGKAVLSLNLGQQRIAKKFWQCCPRWCQIAHSDSTLVDR